MSAPGIKCSILSLAAVLSLIGTASVAQNYAPFSDFQALSASELASLQAMITYQGPMDYFIPNYAFTSTGGHIDRSAFLPYRRAGLEERYGSPTVTFEVAAGLMQAMIDSIAALPGVTDGGVDSSGYVSFALLETAGGTRAFEAIVDRENGRALMREIEEAFATDPNAVQQMRECACWMDLAVHSGMVDISSRVEVRSTEFRSTGISDNFVATLRVTNRSAAVIAAPVLLFPRLGGAGVELRGESGIACSFGPRGDPFLELPVGSGGIAPGASVSIILKAANPGNQKVEMSPVVLAHPGIR